MKKTEELPAYITREEMAVMLKCCVSNIKKMTLDGRINLPELKVRKSLYGGMRTCAYSRKMFMELFEDGIPIRAKKITKNFIEVDEMLVNFLQPSRLNRLVTIENLR